jgi:hypothetical protein
MDINGKSIIYDDGNVAIVMAMMIMSNQTKIDPKQSLVLSAFVCFSIKHGFEV